MDTNRAMGVIVAAHVLLLGVGMLVLARRLTLSPIGATAAGLIAMAAGSTLTKTIQFEQILVLAWIPVLLATIHATITSERPWRAVAAMAATTAAILLAGHPQLVYEAAVLATGATIGFAIGDGRWRRIGHVACGGALGVAIAAPQLVAVLFATADSAISRRTRSRGAALTGVVTPAGTSRPCGAGNGAGPGSGSVRVRLREHRLHRRGGHTPRRRRRCCADRIAPDPSMGDRSGRGRAVGTDVGHRATFAAVPHCVRRRAGLRSRPSSARWLVILALVAALFAGAGVDALWNRAERAHLAGAGLATAVIVSLVVLGVFTTADRRSATIWAVTAAVVLGLLAANSMAPRAAG